MARSRSKQLSQVETRTFPIHCVMVASGSRVWRLYRPGTSAILAFPIISMPFASQIGVDTFEDFVTWCKF